MGTWFSDPYTQEENCYLFHIKIKAYPPQNEIPMNDTISVNCESMLSEISQMSFTLTRNTVPSKGQLIGTESRIKVIKGEGKGEC